MAVPKDVKKVLTKIFLVLREDPTKLTDLYPEYCGRQNEKAYTVENLETLSSNHLFDDNPKMFGITELEGCVIRHYFLTGAETYDLIKDLREEFPNFFKHPETQEYLDYANGRRKQKGLSPLSL